MKTVAPLSRLYLLIFVFAFASCNSSSNSDRVVEILIGAEGGTVESADGLLKLEIPAGALSMPTAISVQRFSLNQSSNLYYELLPSGLTFQTPARMKVNVGTIVPTSNAEELNFASLPVIVTTNEANDGIDSLENLELEADSDSNTFTLSGDVVHFSRFAIGGDINGSVSIEGVPQFAAANSDFGPVQVVISAGEYTSKESLSSAHYVDSSESPVIYGEGNPFPLFPLPTTNSSKTFSLRYACGDPGVGTFKTQLQFVGQTRKVVFVREPSDINIANAFLFGATGPIEEGGDLALRTRIEIQSYLLSGKRLVNCGGSEVVEDSSTTETSVTSGNDQITESASSSSSSGGMATQTAPVISTNSLSILINHTFGSTACPTLGDTVTIQVNSETDVDVSISESLPFLTVDRATTTSSGGLAQFTPSFPCSGYQFGHNDGVVSVTARDPSTGLSSNTLQLPVSVVVNQ